MCFLAIQHLKISQINIPGVSQPLLKSQTPCTRSIFAKNSITIRSGKSWNRRRGEIIKLFDTAFMYTRFSCRLWLSYLEQNLFLRIPLPWERVGLLISLVGTNNPLPIVSGDNERNSETKAIIYFWNGHLRFIPSCNKAKSLALSISKFSRTNWDLSVCSGYLFVFEVGQSNSRFQFQANRGHYFLQNWVFIKADFGILSSVYKNETRVF